MPPKRKNKATKKATTAPPKAPPAAMRTSSQTKRRNSSSLPGAKTSRLLPSEPLHMKTRRAVKTASNQDSSGAPSLASSSSRSSSLDDLAQFEDGHSEIEGERPAKRTRLSTDSGSPHQQSTGSFADQLAANGTHSSESSHLNSHNASNSSKTSSRKRRASHESSESSQTVSANGVPTRTQSDTSEQPRKKKPRTTTQTPAESADQPPELTDASTAPNSPEQIAEVESSQNLHHVLPTNGDAPAKPGRRLPGRRRAPHPDVNVETDLRRQLNLKMSYRSLAKIQKSILEELSNRATTSLKNDPDYYKKCPEYEPLMTALDQHKEKRLVQVNALRTNELEQLERVCIAEEHIEKEKYIQRFKDLQENLLLQCFHYMKRLQREVKAADGAGTEDEDNVVAPTHCDFPVLGKDDRLGSKYASRSRAYVETERVLNEELLKKRFDLIRKDFVARDKEADDSINQPTRFATFTGPDRDDAVCHWNIASLIEAANNVEKTRIPSPAPIIPNEQADALFLLASLSADASRGAIVKEEEKHPGPMPPIVNEGAPVLSKDLRREASPTEPPATTSTDVLMEDDFTPDVEPQWQAASRQQTPIHETNGIQPVKEPEVRKNDAPVRFTHRIMDILNINNDSDVPPAKSRQPQAGAADQTSTDTSSQRANLSQGAASVSNGYPGLAILVNQPDPRRGVSAAQADLMPSRDAYSTSAPTRMWPEGPPKQPNYMKPPSLEELRRKDPLHMIRDMLGTRTLPDGKSHSSQRAENQESVQRESTQRESTQRESSQRENVQREANTQRENARREENAQREHAQREQAFMSAPPLSQPFSPSGASEKQDKGKRSRRTSSTYNASPSMPSLSYQQSPSAAPAYLPRQGSNDQGGSSSQRERDRRLSGSQGSQPSTQQPYAGSPPQYPAEHTKTVSSRQSPFSTPSAPPQLPSISQTLPSKPPGPPPSNVNFRFAHYPVPPQAGYPQSGYQPSSHSSSHGSRHGPPPQYGGSYNGPHGPSGPHSYQGGYVPPPGSFQAPPPPPPPPQYPSASTPYPPLKIHQYGGQPILPANMAPPPPHSQPHPMTFVGQSAPPSAYSPSQQQHQQQQPQHNSSYDANAQRESAAPRSGEPGSGPLRQPRRQYRSYHAPGTQFRSYNGPDSTRRRGG